jgi:hypothetical protein
MQSAFVPTKMLAGDPSANAIRFPGETNFLMPASVDGADGPGATGGLFYTFKDNTFHGGVDRIELFRLNPDFATPANSTFNKIQTFPIAPYTYTVCGFFNFDCIPQGGRERVARCGAPTRHGTAPTLAVPGERIDPRRAVVAVAGPAGGRPRAGGLTAKCLAWMTVGREGVVDFAAPAAPAVDVAIATSPVTAAAAPARTRILLPTSFTLDLPLSGSPPRA